MLENVEEAVADIKALQARMDELGMAMARARRRLRRADGRDGRGADRARPPQRLGHRLPARAGDGRAALPAAGRAGRHALRRRAPPGRALQAAAAAARPAAAGRADQPPGRRVGALAGGPPQGVPRSGAGRHPRPVLPGQRGGVDPRARPRPDPPVRGQLLDLPGDQEGPGCRSRASGTPSGPRSWSASWSGPGPTRRRGRPRTRPGWPGTRRWPPRPSATASWTSRRSTSRRVRGWAAPCWRPPSWSRASATGCCSTG